MTKTATTKLDRTAHKERERNGRYATRELCDGCNKPVGTNYYTDDEVCGGGDGPGFFICERKREGLTVEQRQALYEANRDARVKS